MRSFVRNFIAYPLVRMNYQVTITGNDAALSCTDGAIVVANHVSRLDAVLLMSEAWP